MDHRTCVERARHGDQEAFAALVRGSIGRQDALARVVLRDPGLAEDAVQEALIRAWRDLPGLRDPDRFDAWLYRLTLRAAVDAARTRRRRVVEVQLPSVVLDQGADPADVVADHDALEDAFAVLDPAHRALVLMHIQLGVPVPEAAAALGIPLGTAKSRISRALAQMRLAIAPGAGAGPEGVS